METIKYNSSFLSVEDAMYYLERHLLDHKDYEILEAGIRYVNLQWQAYCQFEWKGGHKEYESQASLW